MKISESIHHPDVLVTVSATDKDSGKFGQILYYVSGDGADLFVIDGNIYCLFYFVERFSKILFVF